jgi:hypothetical protein
MANRTWALMIVDESHNIRCTKKEEKYEVLILSGNNVMFQ